LFSKVPKLRTAHRADLFPNAALDKLIGSNTLHEDGTPACIPFDFRTGHSSKTSTDVEHQFTALLCSCGYTDGLLNLGGRFYARLRSFTPQVLELRTTFAGTFTGTWVLAGIQLFQILMIRI
jgi:hypothetical protein